MLIRCTRFSQMDWEKILALYEEDNRMLGARNYPWLEAEQQLHRAEEDLLSYLREDFFPAGGSCLIWEENGAWVSGLRMEPCADGLLLTALTTLPQERRKGYGLQLVCEARDMTSGFVYAHVHKRNIPSLWLHEKAGFQPYLDHAVLLDGSVLTSHCTVRY